MIGPGGVNIPAQTQDLNLGNKKVSDLIDGDVSISIKGTNVKVSGGVKTITSPWEEFDTKNNTGHFVPMLLPKKCIGQTVTLKGRTEDRTVTIGEDRMLVTRLENLTGIVLTVEMNGKTLMTVDFTGVVPVGEEAYDPEKTDFGSFGTQSDYVEGLQISWDGAKATVTGKLKKFGNGRVSEGYHFPLGMSGWYADGIEKTLTGKQSTKVTDKDIIIGVGEVETPITIEYHGVKVIELDLSAMTKSDQ